MRKRACRCFAPRADDSSDDNDHDSRATRHLHLHDVRTRIVPGRTIGLCLRIRRLGVRIPSGALIFSVNSAADAATQPQNRRQLALS
jgi:hypothetical protein